MTSKFSIVAFCLFVSSAAAAAAVAQDTKPIVVPEKTMAARLLTYETPALSKPMSTNRCSNALAVAHVVVDADGKVSSAEYVSGYSELKDPTLAAVRRWSYKPYVVDGKPAVVETQASVFYLGDGESMPMYVPDGKGGTKGGNMIPLPSGCGAGPQIKRQN
jgi:Gram-negative bacterial TonB protein C-terminal